MQLTTVVVEEANISIFVRCDSRGQCRVTDDSIDLTVDTCIYSVKQMFISLCKTNRFIEAFAVKKIMLMQPHEKKLHVLH